MDLKFLSDQNMSILTIIIILIVSAAILCIIYIIARHLDEKDRRGRNYYSNGYKNVDGKNAFKNGNSRKSGRLSNTKFNTKKDKYDNIF